VTGGGEGEGRRIEWPLVISIAALLFGVVQFVREINDDGEAQAVRMEARLRTIECKLNIDCGGKGD
jgi:hypothetical protein